MKKGQGERDKFLLFLKGLAQMLKRCDTIEEYQLEKQKIVQFISKNISNLQGVSKIACDFDFKFQLSRIDTLKEKVKSLESEVEQGQQALQRERGDRKKMASLYNQKIVKLRELYDGLRERVQLQEQQSRRKIRSILVEKNQIIDSLKSKLKQSRTRKNSLQIKKSRETRKSFIGDGQYSHLELTELNEAIQNLEMQIIKEF